MKSTKREVFLTTAICLLPVLAGVLLWHRLPDPMPTHFNAAGEADGWSSRAFGVFFLPGLMVGINLLLHFALSTDPKRQNMSPALRAVSVWTLPVISVLTSALTYGSALGHEMNVQRWAPALVALLFVLIGNYLPKTKQSYTMGIKLPWTLASEENWNRTHRLAGFLWVICGAVMLLVSLLGVWNMAVLLGLPLVMAAVPCVYSYLLYRKGV